VRRALPATFLSGSFIDVDSSLHDIREHEVVIAQSDSEERVGQGLLDRGLDFDPFFLGHNPPG
jgi:hypothetical protein